MQRDVHVLGDSGGDEEAATAFAVEAREVGAAAPEGNAQVVSA